MGTLDDKCIDFHAFLANQKKEYNKSDLEVLWMHTLFQDMQDSYKTQALKVTATIPDKINRWNPSY